MRIKTFLFISVILVMRFCCGWTAEISSARFLLVPPGSRPNGMGEAFTAVADDNNAVYWNPAGISMLSKKEISFTHMKGLIYTSLDYLTYVQPVKSLQGAIAASIFHLSDPQWRLNEDGDFEGEFENTAQTVIISYGREITSSFSSGINFKLLQWKLDNRMTGGAAVDIGFLYSGQLNIGFAVQNVGTKMKFIRDEFSLPLMANLGIGYKAPDNRMNLALDINRYVVDEKTGINLGAEYVIKEMFSARAGYKYHPDDAESKHLAGLSLGVGFGVDGYCLDYAFVPYGELGDIHNISFTIKF